LLPAIIPRPPEDFEFDLSFVITSFTFVSVRSGDIFSSPGRGNQLSQEMKTFIGNAKRGTKVWLENIIAEGPMVTGGWVPLHLLLNKHK